MKQVILRFARRKQRLPRSSFDLQTARGRTVDFDKSGVGARELDVTATTIETELAAVGSCGDHDCGSFEGRRWARQSVSALLARGRSGPGACEMSMQRWRSSRNGQRDSVRDVGSDPLLLDENSAVLALCLEHCNRWRAARSLSKGADATCQVVPATRRCWPSNYSTNTQNC